MPRSTYSRPLALSRPAALRPRALATSRQPRRPQNRDRMAGAMCRMPSRKALVSRRRLMIRCWASGCLLPGGSDAAHNASGSAEAPGQKRKHRVRFMSVRETDSMRPCSSMRRIRRTDANKPQVSGYPVRLKSRRSAVRSRPWPLRERRFLFDVRPITHAELRRRIGRHLGSPKRLLTLAIWHRALPLHAGGDAELILLGV